MKVWPPVSYEWLQTNQNLLCGVPLVAGSYNAKITCFSKRVMELCMSENFVLVLPVNILIIIIIIIIIILMDNTIH